MASPRRWHGAPNQGGNKVCGDRIYALLYPLFEVRLTSSQNDNLTSNQRCDSIAPETAGANAITSATAQHPPRASSLSPHTSENSSAGSGEDTADDSFASVITVVPLQRVARSLWQPPGSPGAAIDPPRASTDSFRSIRRSGLRPRQRSAASDPFVETRSRAGTTETTGTTGTTGSSTPLLSHVLPVRPERAHTVQRGRETRRDLSGGRLSIETTPGERLRIKRATITTGSTPGNSNSNSTNIFSRSRTNTSRPATITTSLTTGFDNINLSSPLRPRTDSTIAMKDGKSGSDDFSRLTPSSKDKSVLGSIKRGMHNLGSIRGRKTPKSADDESIGGGSGASSDGNRGSGTPGSNTIKKKKSLAALSDMFGSLKATITPRPRAQAAFELQLFPSEQSMMGGLLLHGPQRLELARGGDGRYATKDKNGPVYPPRLPLGPRTEPRRGDPNSGLFLSPRPAFSQDDGPASGASASRFLRPDPYENKPLPPLPPKVHEDGGDYEGWKKGGKGGEEKGNGKGREEYDAETTI